MKRRIFGKHLLAGVAGVSLLQSIGCKTDTKGEVGKTAKSESDATDSPFFKLSLAQWSFHKALQGGVMDHLHFAVKAKSLGFEGIEYVSQFFADKVTDISYLAKMNQEAMQNDINQLLIMVDGEGGLALTDKIERLKSVENHRKWLDAAEILGCHSIRVNCFGEGERDAVMAAGVEGLSRLSELGAKKNLNVIVENHGGYSSDGAWLAELMGKVNMENCGTLPDFGNFCVKREGGVQWGAPCVDEYDMYKGVEELMPFAKAVSAKSFDFDDEGNETKIDFYKMLNIVKKAGFNGYIGVEYEGENLGEEEGIVKTRDLLIAAAKKL